VICERKPCKTEPITKAAANECIEFLEKWCEERDCGQETQEELYCEKQAAINTLENIELLGVNGLLLRIDGKVSAFGMASRLTPTWVYFILKKPFPKSKGFISISTTCAPENYSRAINTSTKKVTWIFQAWQKQKNHIIRQ
jgi:hypothetical protein